MISKKQLAHLNKAALLHILTDIVGCEKVEPLIAEMRQYQKTTSTEAWEACFDCKHIAVALGLELEGGGNAP